MEIPSIYAQVLGPAFTNLAPALKQLHRSDQRQFSGVLTVRTGSHPLARLSLWLSRLPRAQVEAPCDLCLVPTRRGELWQRDIGKWNLVTHQRCASREERLNGGIRERFGAITLALHLRVKSRSLHIRSIKTRILGIPLPGWLGIAVVAHESQIDENSFYCNVRVYLPGLRPLLRYRGKLSKPWQGSTSSFLAKSHCQEPSARSFP